MKSLDEVMKDTEEMYLLLPGDNPFEVRLDVKRKEELLHYLQLLKDISVVCKKHGITSIWGIELPEVGNTK